MKIAILGYGKEGKSAQSYFQKQHHDIKIFDNFTPEDLTREDFSNFDLILRSPSLQPQPGWSSMTRYFFAHCPCPIIGVTGTKGKGTTCSIITALLKALGCQVWLVGNIGTPALDILDQIQPTNLVVYEMSSFQLWDLETSPHVAIVLPIEPDHLNIHKDYQDYVNAKANITKHQTADDFCIYYDQNPDSIQIAEQSSGRKLPYPLSDHRAKLNEVLDHLTLRGQHNRENAEAALLAVAAALGQTLDELLSQHKTIITQTLSTFQGLPHRLQYLRTLNHIDYYDDNFCTNAPSQLVALKAFPHEKVVLIAGGRDKTNNEDLPEIAHNIQTSGNVAKVILMGESGHELAKILPPDNFIVVENLADAVKTAREVAEQLSDTKSPAKVIVLMSPAAASFDMFENVYDRGAQFQSLVQGLV